MFISVEGTTFGSVRRGEKKVKKNRAGPRPCSQRRMSTRRYATLRLEFVGFQSRRLAAFAPACPPKTWTVCRSDGLARMLRSLGRQAQKVAQKIASRLDLAYRTLSDLLQFVTGPCNSQITDVLLPGDLRV